MPDQKYMSHSYENCFGKLYDPQYIKEGLRGDLGDRDDAVKHYNKSEHKWKKEMKALKKQNKMLFSIAKNSG